MLGQWMMEEICRNNTKTKHKASTIGVEISE
jgi:hypothetical protein